MLLKWIPDDQWWSACNLTCNRCPQASRSPHKHIAMSPAALATHGSGYSAGCLRVIHCPWWLSNQSTSSIQPGTSTYITLYYITTLKLNEEQFSGEPVPWTKPGMSFIRWDLPRQHKQPITKGSKISICSIHCQWTSMLNWYILVVKVRLEKTFQSKSQGINNQHVFWHHLR